MRSDCVTSSLLRLTSVSCVLSYAGVKRWWPIPCTSAVCAANARSVKDDARSATYLAVLWD